MKTNLDTDGRIQLPSEVQSQLGVRPGDAVILDSKSGLCVIRPAHAKVGLCQEGNVLIHRGTCDSEAGAILSDTREDRLKELSQGLSG